MSLDDRDWYREDLARRLRRARRQERLSSLRGLAAAGAILVAVVAVAPLVMTPRASYQASWRAIAQRVTGNIHCTRIVGFAIHVRPRPCQ
jgi:hypothetical protein